MENLNERDGYDPAAKVRLFLDALAVLDEKPLDEESIVARLCSLLLIVFRDIIQKFTDSKLHADEKVPVSISLQRSLDRLKLWSDGYRICAGDQDVNFIKSRRLRRAAIEVLVSISDTLLERLEPLTSSKKTEISDNSEESVKKLKDVLETARSDLDHDSSSSDGSSYYGPDSLEDIAKDLETDTLSLMGVDALFQSAILDSFAEKATFVDAAQAWLPHDVYKDKIRTRFPKAEISLVSRLSKASYDRYLRCQRERESQTTAVGDVDFPKFTRSDASSSKFRDSGLGTSIPSSASVAETAMSYRAEGKASVRIPPLSKEAKEGKPFECISCGKTLSIRNNSAWKRHLYQDLLPWQCLDPDCSFTTVFRTREDWIAHIAQDHKSEPDWQSIICPLCFDAIPAGKIAITKHLCNHLEEISLAALPANLDVESHSGSDSDSCSSQSQEESKEETNETSNLKALKPDTSGQEPILQDALDYLDQVKLVFHDRPAIYNRFLEIMKDFKAQAIDTPGVMRLVADLFVVENQVQLISGFNSFLPPGYAIDEDLNFRMPGAPVSNLHVQNEPKSKYMRLQQNPAIIYRCQYPGCKSEFENRPDNLRQHQIDNGHFPDGQEIGKPGAHSAQSSASLPPTGFASFSSSASPKRLDRKTKEEEPVSFNTSLAYVNRIKKRFVNEPEKYRQFLEILQEYQREQTTIQDVYTSVATLFASAPELLDDFKLFLPGVEKPHISTHEAMPGRYESNRKMNI